jgi:hypothetical protein
MLSQLAGRVGQTSLCDVCESPLSKTWHTPPCLRHPAARSFYILSREAALYHSPALRDQPAWVKGILFFVELEP